MSGITSGITRVKKQAETAPAAKPNAALTYLKNNMTYYLLLLPGLICVILFRFVPLYGMLIAFKSYDINRGFAASEWVGFKWFGVLFQSPAFKDILRNTLSINFLEILVVFTGSIIFALLINEIKNSGFKRLVQTVSYLPYFLSWVVVGGMIMQMLSPDSPLIKWLFSLSGQQPVSLLMQDRNFYPIVVTGELWKNSGWNTILYLAAITGISAELYEAAKIDGAGKFRQIIYITLPGIKYVIILTLLMKVGAMMNVGFEKIFVLQNGMNTHSSEVFSTYNYKIGIGQWNMSLSSALSFFESVVNFILVFGFDRMAKLFGEEGIF
jgi:putative aldouronate transport system permease protein